MSFTFKRTAALLISVYFVIFIILHLNRFRSEQSRAHTETGTLKMDPSLICRSNLQRAHVGPSAKENVSIKCEQMLKAEVEGTKLPAFEDSGRLPGLVIPTPDSLWGLLPLACHFLLFHSCWLFISLLAFRGGGGS